MKFAIRCWLFSRALSLAARRRQITHSARGYKVQGLQTVDLSWTGATSSSSSGVSRNDVLIVTVPNNNFYTDHPNGRGHAIYTSKVCGADTGNCSNQVNVNF
jgi:serine protease